MTESQLDRRRLLRSAGGLLLLLVVLPFVIFAVPQVVGASQSYVVLSSSMSPSIHAGDVIIVETVDPSDVDNGTVITYRTPGDSSDSPGTDRVTHRVVEVVEQDGERHFRTKGDANEDPDSELVPADNVIGEVWFTIPLIGHVISFAGTPLGTVMLVIIPLTLFALNEIWSFFWTADADDTE